ncbi:uncharacterized protein F4812DRAFT_144237 [Daldinia caldariorum]|uniref:uncharacterized protein n=1 Tax=Daldinia caldariorum TaxID=326644 RepID=UPI0020082FF6|nr:uncharacterized protein F4812DRAFT_144237 [Daldinia caldariorum]KAI1464900.1 hypothetical protein F4812DRAFT_144237 [Daldinia caldariorum]
MTNLGPLTTAYQPQGTGCHSIHVGSTTDGVWLQYGTTSGCLPSNFRRYDGYYYSPGVCPEGYTYACTAGVALGTSSATVATCCPSGYTCSRAGPSDPNACRSTMLSPTAFIVDVLSYSGDFITSIGTSSTFCDSGREVFAKGLAVWRASNDAEWPVPTTVNLHITTSAENTSRTTPSIAATTSETAEAPNTTTELTGKSDNLSNGAKIVIAVGVLFGVLLFVGAILAAYRIGKKKGKLPRSLGSDNERRYEFETREERFKQERSVVEMNSVREPVELMSLQR